MLAKKGLVLQIFQMSKGKIDDLLRVYHDLEKTLRHLKINAERNITIESALGQINIRKLIHQLSRSRRRIERKIGNTLLLEKQHLKQRIRTIANNLSHKHTEL